MYWYILAWKNCFNFSGRARRKEYWYFQFLHLIVFIIFLFLEFEFDNIVHFEKTIFSLIYLVSGLIPAISLLIRRLHDSGHSGWMYFVGLIPFIGEAWLLFLLVLDSEPGENKYGPNPKGIELEEEIESFGL